MQRRLIVILDVMRCLATSRFSTRCCACNYTRRIELPPGAVLKLLGNWKDYQVLSQQLGDRSSPRIKYRRGEILLMAPLPQHGRDASLPALIVIALLDYLNRAYESFTPITISLPEISGIEPDFCFYLENSRARCT
ncbi:MAG: Uma2 family endonuclease [Nostoc sp.]|uniref:Uma2 family endonuclease n=1 Tax=Nostoc sp. TaxID=1180 RepID=UPI002FF4A17F